MAITLVDGVYSDSPAGGGTTTVNFAGAQSGDVVHCFMGTGGFIISSGPSGYTEIGSVDSGTRKLFRKVLSAADTSVGVPQDATFNCAVYVAVWRGADNTTPEDTAAVAQSASADPPSITTVTNDSAVAAYAWAFGGTGFSAGPSGYSNFETGKTGNEAAGFAWTTKASAGAENPGAFTHDAGGNVACFTAAVRPAAAVDTGDATVDITGTAQVGQTLTAVFNDDDPDGAASGISYQWEADGVEIVGATSSTYLLTEDELGAVITVVVDYTDGAANAESIESDPTAEVVAAPVPGGGGAGLVDMGVSGVASPKKASTRIIRDDMEDDVAAAIKALRK